MPTCVLCGSDTFDEYDGHFFCDKCGTQSQEIRNEADVEEDADNFGLGNSHKRQMRERRKKQGPRSKHPATDFGKPWLTFEAFQCLLKAQVNALIKLGVNPALKDIVCQIWFHFLQRKKVAFTGASQGSSIAVENMTFKRDRLPGTEVDPMPRKGARSKKKDTAANDDTFWEDMDEEFYEDDLEDVEPDENGFSSGEDSSRSDESWDNEDDSEDSEPEHIGSVRYKHHNKRGGWAELQHRLTIVLIYIGLLYTKEPITAADLLRLIANGNLPFYKISEILPGHMKFSQEDTSTFLTRPVRIRNIHDGTTHIINYLDLPPIPEPNLCLIIARLIMDLQLPGASTGIHAGPRLNKAVQNEKEPAEQVLVVVLLGSCMLCTVLSRLRSSEKPVNASVMMRITRRFCLRPAIHFHFFERAAVHRLTISLFSASGFKPRSNFRCRRETKCNEFFEEISMAFVIVAVKLIYGLDGETERNGKILKAMLDVPPESLECWGCLSLRLYKKRKTAIQQTYPNKEEDLKFINNVADYSLFCAEEIFNNFNDCASNLRTGDVHIRYRACRKAAREEYHEIMKHALNDLTKGQAKFQMKIKPTSFVYEHIPSEKNAKDVNCKCRSLSSLVNLRGKKNGEDTKDMSIDEVREGSNERESYVIYCNDLSGLKAHDSYKFFLNICAERILVRQAEMHDYVTYVESMLFVDQ